MTFLEPFPLEERVISTTKLLSPQQLDQQYGAPNSYSPF